MTITQLVLLGCIKPVFQHKIYKELEYYSLNAQIYREITRQKRDDKGGKLGILGKLLFYYSNTKTIHFSESFLIQNFLYHMLGKWRSFINLSWNTRCSIFWSKKVELAMCNNILSSKVTWSYINTGINWELQKVWNTRFTIMNSSFLFFFCYFFNHHGVEMYYQLFFFLATITLILVT